MSLAHFHAPGRMLLSQRALHWLNNILPGAWKCANDILPGARRFALISYRPYSNQFTLEQLAFEYGLLYNVYMYVNTLQNFLYIFTIHIETSLITYFKLAKMIVCVAF